MRKISITKAIEFDAGHRIPNHKSKCRHPHGHRYKLEVTLEGPVNETEGDSSQGMVLDFADVKAIAMREIHDKWDHAFLVWDRDSSMLKALIQLTQDDPAVHRIVKTPCIPTAENLADFAFDILKVAYQGRYGNDLVLTKVRLFETPTSWVDAVGDKE